jgi:hypothetical protein
MGSFGDPPMVLSPYPTADPDSTIHPNFATVNDMSNSSIARLLVKLSFRVANFRTTGVCMVEVFSRRLDCKTMLGNSDRVLYQAPKLLRQFWMDFAFSCLDLSTAWVLLLVGGTAYEEEDYVTYLEEREVVYEKIHFLSATKELSVAVKEYESDGVTTTRLAVIIFHPERFARDKSAVQTESKMMGAFRERLIDYATTLLYGEPHMQTFFTSCNYLFNLVLGNYVSTNSGNLQLQQR